MTATIVWYLHDRGAGHLARARAVIPHLTAPVVVAAGPGIAPWATRVLDVPVVELASDVPARPVATVGPWHHAPADIAQRERALALAAVVDGHACTTAVVDVSMEVTVLARLLGLRVVALRQSGRRDDAAHRTGLATADVVWVPQHSALEPLDAPPDARWAFTGAFSRFDGCRPAHRRTGTRRTAVVVIGSGGTQFDAAAWRAATPPPGWSVSIVGAPERWAGPIPSVGHVEPILPVLAAADVVLTSAGWGAVADGVAAGARLVVVAEPRPFAEQEVRAHALGAAGLVHPLVRWPDPAELGDVLDAALVLDPQRWSSFYDHRGARRAAALIDELHAA